MGWSLSPPTRPLQPPADASTAPDPLVATGAVTPAALPAAPAETPPQPQPRSSSLGAALDLLPALPPQAQPTPASAPGAARSTAWKEVPTPSAASIAVLQARRLRRTAPRLAAV
jgi:hypothetical protein